ncbi:Retrovirus-related Pol polyprotein from transposon 17.6 [Araneus ventricosus]|uniref:RNA-directed DNA polymerase n=1 Tax=Araneus ventricosus TaxID=182803 RepID=A0A4Y2SA70_ARAVE|nr:Retrovirus-related Pol polyprotein from transposon 17.6 [Araneus ventricosus]GBM61398.1 Retrovirus-related Pol polyprotein from transposon 17.6 [Araneus ventricosus]GBN84466.1 Retrovirus-related Pol polyprotein from transposon 17.6 [Araneus ventricosus]
MSNDIADFVRTCMGCQLRRKDKISDRAPITPVARPELPFETVNIDLIGPIEPPSGRGHKYVLCLMDQMTRWPEAIPLRSLSAKATCDALLQIFSRTGIPNVIASDRGTNFTSSLTEEFVKRIGSSPRFSCPGYPASNGLVERWNGVLKNMLHHIIREDPRNWDHQIPFLLFAYREVPNTTTGVSPFRLMYGREARGPLAILKSSWAGEVHLPTNVTPSAVDYLQEMKIKMEKAAEKASLVAADKQKSYSEYFNKRSSVRAFNIGEQVVLLIPDSSNKLYARWTGPGEIVEHHPPHSYKVRLADGTVRHVHANKIRKYHPRSLAVGVIFEEDHDFGEINPTPNTSDVDSRELCEKINLNHLSDEQRNNLCGLLLRHNELFTGKMKVAKVGAHRIRLKPDAERKKPFVYRIPEALKDKVDEQIDELLALDLIEESDAEIAYPIVCVNKKDGSIRLCVDYRALNAVTVSDDFPMEEAVDLIQSIGKANVITTLDLLKGYWAIPMDLECKALTSFKTHRQQYQFKVMSFGLKNASATFQRVINRALSQYRNFSRAYIDDIAVYSENWEEHMIHLETILCKLRELNFAVNLKKCSFARPHVKYLGHVIGSGRHQPDPDKTNTIENLPQPKTKKELRSVLGLCNYYREYIPSYSELVYPLTELTKKKVPDSIPWTKEHDLTFDRLKRALVEAPSLYTPKPDQPFIVHSDASQIGVAACLSQRAGEKCCPIAYASQKLTRCQQSWSTIEREAFAIVWCLKKFEVWVYGSEIEFYTDHNPLPFLTKGAPQSARLQRWAFALQRYNITIKHCPGAKMPHADALSRLV